MKYLGEGMIRHKQSLHNSLPPPLFFKEETSKECKKSVRCQWQGLVAATSPGGWGWVCEGLQFCLYWGHFEFPFKLFIVKDFETYRKIKIVV